MPTEGATGYHRERPTKLIGIGAVGCQSVLSVRGLRIPREDIVRIKIAGHPHVDVAHTSMVLVDDSFENGQEGDFYAILLKTVSQAGVCIVVFALEDPVSSAAALVGKLARKTRVPVLALVATAKLPDGTVGSMAQQRQLESLYEAFDSVLIVPAEEESLGLFAEHGNEQQQFLRGAIECITRNMMTVDIADATLSRTFLGHGVGLGGSSADATARALAAVQADRNIIDSTRMILVLVTSAAQAPTDVNDAVEIADEIFGASSEIIASSATDKSLLDATSVMIVYLSARSNSITFSSGASAERSSSPISIVRNIRNDSPLKAKAAKITTEWFDDENEPEDINSESDGIAFRAFSKLYPIGSRFEAKVMRSTRGGVGITMQGGFTGLLALDAKSNHVEMTQIGQRLVVTVAEVFATEREIGALVQRVDVPKLAVPVLPKKKRHRAFALSDFIVHPVDVNKVLEGVQGGAELHLATFPLRVSATIPLPERIDEAFLKFMMETPPAPIRTRFLHPQFNIFDQLVLAVIGIFPSGAIRTVGRLSKNEGVAELHIYSLWHLLDPGNDEEDIHRNAARIAVDLVGLAY